MNANRVGDVEQVLHLPTIMIVYALGTLMVGAISAAIWRRDRANIAFGILVWASAFGILGAVLHGTRNILPFWLSTGLGFPLAFAGIGLFWSAFLVFEGRRFDYRLVLLGSGLSIIFAMFPVFEDSSLFRLVFASTIIGTYNLLCAWEVHRGKLHEPLPNRNVAIALTAGHAALWFVRIPLALFFEPALQGDTYADWFVILSLLSALNNMFAMFALSLLSKDRSERQQRIAAQTDALTGLRNRLSFGQAIEDALNAATEKDPVAIMFIDLDRFKSVNDTLGHPVGDMLLRQVSARLEWTVGEADVVARMGGDEFAIIQRGGAQPQAALTLGARIIDQLHSPFTIDGHKIEIGGSIGIAVAPVHGTDMSELQRKADIALYAVKDAGKGHCRVFDPTMTARRELMDDLEHAIRTGLQSDAFQMHYQPLIDLRTNRVWGAEALARWQHPTRGYVEPDVFIPLAEELGVMQQLGARLMEIAFTDAARWPASLKVAVNISPAQIHRHDVLSDVLVASNAAGLDLRRVELEVTEKVLLTETAAVLATLHTLKSSGLGIALDDFGTGYSSLGHLNAFPFDRVKIDASFISGLPSAESEAIIRAVCSLCDSFGIGASAEGVETRPQLDFVRGLGCVSGQGYFYAHPMPETAFRAFLASFDHTIEPRHSA